MAAESLYSGWLVKRAMSGKNSWKKRYFDLAKGETGGTITYRPKEGAAPKGTIPVLKETTVEIGKDEKKGDILIVHTFGRKLVAHAAPGDDASVLEAWVEKVTVIIDSFKPPPPPPPPPPPIAPPEPAGGGLGGAGGLGSVASAAKQRIRKAYTWGAADVGQAGDGHRNETGHAVPVLVEALVKANEPVDIQTGDTHMLALSTKGWVFAWGGNAFGQLGLKHQRTTMRPALLSTLRSKTVRIVACGTDHSLAATADGDVYSWGKNEMGQLGLGIVGDPIDEPTQVEQFGVAAKLPVMDIDGGGGHSAFLTTNHQVYTTGNNVAGQLGRADGSPGKPEIVALPDDVVVIQVLCCMNGTGFVTASKQLYLAGSVGYTSEQYEAQREELGRPRLVSDLPGDVVCVGMGGQQVIAATSKGVYSWGMGSHGNPDVDDSDVVAAPTAVNTLARESIKQIAVSSSHCIVRTADGRMFSWGTGEQGELGNGFLMDGAKPVQVKAVTDMHFVHCTVGDQCSAALMCGGAAKGNAANAAALKLGMRWKALAKSRKSSAGPTELKSAREGRDSAAAALDLEKMMAAELGDGAGEVAALLAEEEAAAEAAAAEEAAKGELATPVE